MNKSTSRQKRTIGRDSPLSKRPKLDFTLRSTESPTKSKDNGKETVNGHHGCNTRINAAANFADKLNENFATTSDWDDDFSGDMLEKVCLIADLSQAMVNKQQLPKDIEQKNIEREKSERNTLPPSIGLETGGNTKNVEELENLKLELESLREKFKTKEGEVSILRSQLKQNEDSKQMVVMQNIKVIEEMQTKYNEKVISAEKELESIKTKLQFRDLEYKTLSERCRQLEYNISKNKQSDLTTHLDGKKYFSSTQASQQVNATKADGEGSVCAEKNLPDTVLFEIPDEYFHEGKELTKIICPEFFKFIEEPSVVPFYTFRSGSKCHKSRIDFDKREEYKWSNMPKQTVHFKDLYNSVTVLFGHETFSHRENKQILENIFTTCEQILTHHKDVLVFLEKLPCHGSEYDDPDQSLLENEEEIQVITIKSILDGKKLKDDECGIEGRRCLGLIYALIKTSSVAVDMIKSNKTFILLLRDLAAAVGNLRRPLRYTGTLAGISFILGKLLQEKTLQKEILIVINETIDEIIFARPKLDVLMEVLKTMAAGHRHAEFLSALCRKASVDSCALYMNSKLKQAMFFTKKACPLKILCMQVMGLAGLPSSKCVLWEVTNAVIKWLNNSMNTPDCRAIKWLPTNPQDRCFDVNECLLYLLSLCLKDYSTNFPMQEDEGADHRLYDVKKRKYSMSIISHGAVLAKRILKADPRLLHDSTHCMRFATLLKTVMPNKSDQCHLNHLSHLSSVHVEAISWIVDLLESDLRNQDCYLKQSTSILSDEDIFNALKINDDKMY